jgi:two-component system, OmpR family, sensor histidine kinase VicK
LFDFESSSWIDKDSKKESLGDNAISVDRQKIKEIEAGVEPEFYDVINDHQKASQILVDLAKSIKSEALILLPNDKSMVRLDRIGVIDYTIKASRENAAGVKIICPLSKVNFNIVKKISDYAPTIKVLNGNNSLYGMFIVDSHKFFKAELREPDAEELSEAIGFAIYSNSKVSANSFKSVFEMFWSERMLNEELKRVDKMQKDFINVAAHELRTPAQAILGYAELATTDHELNKHDKRGFIDAIYRNALRLHRLTRDILDVTRIESHTLQLNKELVNLNNVIANTVLDVKRQNICTKDKVSVTYKVNQDKKDSNNNNNNNDGIFVEADKERITQVLYNLLENAVKFSKDTNNTVLITLEQKKQEEDAADSNRNNSNNGKGQQQVEKVAEVKIEDRGIGIHSEIFPRLFTKFATKSLTGTGLGLYICKSIVEAHGGKIWAKNNSNGNGGATFAFSLPLAK